MTLSPEQARFMGVAIATAMNELEISLQIPKGSGVIRPNPEPKAPRKQKAKPKASTPKKSESTTPKKRKTSSKKKKDPLAPRKSKKSASPKPKRRTPEENSRIVHEVNGYLGMAKKASTQAGARIWLLKATKATPSGWTATHNQIARKHALHCPDIAA